MRIIQCYRMRRVTQCLIPALAFWGALTVVGDDKDSQTAASDSSFIKEAARGGEAEVQMGRLAADKGMNPQIKELGRRLDKDHSKANQELIPIAQKCGVTLPTESGFTGKLEGKFLEGKTGADFDQAFAEHEIKDHEKDIESYQKALQESNDPDLKAYIQKCLPVLREHLQMARNAASAVGVDEKTLASADPFLANQSAQITEPLPISGTVDKNQVDQTQGLGRAAGTETGTATGGYVPRTPISPGTLKSSAMAELPVAVQNTVVANGDPQSIRDIKTTMRDGQTVYIVKTERDGKKVILHIAEDGTLRKANWFSRLFSR